MKNKLLTWLWKNNQSEEEGGKDWLSRKKNKTSGGGIQEKYDKEIITDSKSYGRLTKRE